MRASGDVYDFISFIQSEIVGHFKEMMKVIVSTHATSEHILAVLAIEEHSTILSQDNSVELSLHDFLVVSALGRSLDSS